MTILSSLHPIRRLHTDLRPQLHCQSMFLSQTSEAAGVCWVEEPGCHRPSTPSVKTNSPVYHLSPVLSSWACAFAQFWTSMHQWNAAGLPSGLLTRGTALFPLSFAMQRERRRAERRWLVSGLHVHEEILNAAKHRVIRLVQKPNPPPSPHRFLKAPLPDNCTLPVLFLASQRSPPPKFFFFFLVSGWISWKKFLDYFSGKICTIRDKFDTTQTTSPPLVEHISLDSHFLLSARIRANCQKCDCEIST